MSGLPLAGRWLCEMEDGDDDAPPRRGRRREGIVFLVLFALTIPAANWLIGHVGTVVRAGGALPRAGRARAAGALGRDRWPAWRWCCAIWCSAGSGSAVVVARHRCGRGALGVAGAAGARARLGGRLPAVGVGRPCGLHAAGPSPPGRRGGGLEHGRPGGRLRSCFLWLAFGSLDFLPGQIVGKAWMVLLSIPFVAGCAGATSGSASRRLDSATTSNEVSP